MANLTGSPDNSRASVHSEFLSNHSLACRLERTEATANARFVEARALLEPQTDAQWIEVAGAYAMFDGVRSPCTQTFGLGLLRLPTNAEINEIERFFTDREAPIFHEVSPLADQGLVPMLNERGYQPIEFTSVMFLPLDRNRQSAPNRADHINVRIIGEPDRDRWARTAAEGWQAETEFADMMYKLMRINASRAGGPCFLAELGGQPIATGALAIHDGIALLAGASTLPQWRRQGAQKALLEARLQYAIEAGCDLAMLCAAPGSASQRNGERQGFRIAYTRVKFELKGERRVPPSQ
jgi:GNAT superfamily N-acetyltransferase